MKRLLILFLFLLASLNTPSAYIRGTYIMVRAPFNEYDRLFHAICMVESSMRPDVINEHEGAYGLAQIRQCRLDEYNQLTGKSYILTDCFNSDVAREIFMYYCQGRDFETIARAWCSGEAGTKRASEKYWRKVRAEL